MCLTLGVTILASTTEIQIMVSSQSTIGVLVWSANASMYRPITLFFLTDLYMHKVSLSVESEDIYGYIYTFQQT